MPSSSDESDILFQSHYNPPVSSRSSSSSSPSRSPSPTPLQHQPSTNHFAPPFYGRPPTPLPPSPSLTSLLRPSRPTTPDSSDRDELDPNRARNPVPRASPVVPTYEYYGFVLYLFSSLAFLIYILWSYLPSPFLHAFGIYYYPNRWWSLAIPSWLVMGLVYIYVALASYNTGYLTLGLESIETVVDDAANIAIIDAKGRVRGSQAASVVQGQGAKKMRESGRARGEAKMPGSKRDWKGLWSEGTDAVMDVPLGGVCEVLYGEGRDEDNDEKDP